MLSSYMVSKIIMFLIWRRLSRPDNFAQRLFTSSCYCSLFERAVLYLKLGMRVVRIWFHFVDTNPCTQMAIRFSAEIKIESKNYNIAIFIYSKIEKKKFNTNGRITFHFFSFKLWEIKMCNSFLIVFNFKFVYWLMVNDY